LKHFGLQRVEVVDEALAHFDGRRSVGCLRRERRRHSAHRERDVHGHEDR
jgi:hypothetical protein